MFSIGGKATITKRRTALSLHLSPCQHRSPSLLNVPASVAFTTAQVLVLANTLELPLTITARKDAELSLHYLSPIATLPV
jgi:hypothetical protein